MRKILCLLLTLAMLLCVGCAATPAATIRSRTVLLASRLLRTENNDAAA